MAKPSLYKAQYCDELIACAKNGDTLDVFAGRIGVGRRTVFDWVDKHPDFKAAKEIAQSASIAWWFDQYKNSLFTDKETKVNQTLLVFAMKNIASWRDQISTINETTLNIPKPQDPEEAKRIAAVALKVIKGGKPEGKK